MYGSLPVNLGLVDISCPEMCFYQYLPVKLSGQASIPNSHLEPRLHWTVPLIGKACCDYIGLRNLNDFVDSYVYLTVKYMYQYAGHSYNRNGWHSDGFRTEDINYIWSDCCPTVFSKYNFHLPSYLSEKASLYVMQKQAPEGEMVTYPDKHLLRLDEFNIHKVDESAGNCMRTFIKVSISKDMYDLKGNSHNYQLNYEWQMFDRKLERNVPQHKLT